MCTYLNGRLIAFTGTLPPVVASNPEPVRPMIASGEREHFRLTRDQQARRERRKDKKQITHCGKQLEIIPGDKPYRHTEHIRAAKAATKRHIH